MSSMSAMEREQKKRQLKRRMIEPGAAPSGPGRYESRGEDEEEIVRKAERRVRRKHLRIILILLLLIAAGIFTAYRYIGGHEYTTYTVAWEKVVPASESGFAGYEKFGDNLLKYTKDGATYIDKSGNPVWSLSYQMKSPICYVNGDFAAIADQQGNTIYICDKTGVRGEASTLLPILRVSVSAYGVAAALVEDGKATYITFYQPDGSELKETGIKTVMEKSGYLMDLALSPDGTQVMVSVLYQKDGALKNRIVFYNFSEFGKSYPDRLVGGFDDEFADSLCPRVRFLNEDRAVAIGDDQIDFFSLENVTSPELLKQIPVAEEIQSVDYSDGYVALVVDNPSGEYDYRLDVYKADGSTAFSKEFNFQYRQLDIDGDFVIMYNENSCVVYSMSGKERFSGEFDFTISKVTRGAAFNSLIITGGDTMRELRLK